MEKINVLGMPCPIPVVKAKAELQKPECQGVIVLVDNIVAVQNLEKMSSGLGYDFSCQETSNDVYEVIIGKRGGEQGGQERGVSSADEITVLKNSPADPAEEGLVVAVSREGMGAGSDELGRILMKGFIFSLTTLEIPPTHVLFFNGGAHLTSAGANTIEDLKSLEAKGTKILTCGTCANYYDITDKLQVGSITDMYGIVQTMAWAGKVINI